VESTWFHQGTLIFKFRGVDTISDAELLTGAEVRVPLDQRTPLEPGEFFQDDLVGCQVVDRRPASRWARFPAGRMAAAPVCWWWNGGC
jgi:ribosomal 30S subunit maturation factor RimM